MYDTIPLPSAASRALEVQHNIHDALTLEAERIHALRSRMRAGELSRTSLAAATAVHATRMRLAEIERECALMRGELEAIEWRMAL
jgi:hypothetical protein